MAPQGRFFVPIEPRSAPPPRGHRRRQRHHADPVDHEDRAGARADEPLHADLRQPCAASRTMFKEEIEDLKNRYMTRLVLHHVFSDEHTDAPINSGVMNRDKIGEFLNALVPARSINHAFVCGPFQMNDEAEAALLAAGVPEERIHIERFGIAPQAAQAGGRGGAPGAARRRRAGPDRRSSATACGARSTFRKDQPSILDARLGRGPGGAVLVHLGRVRHLPRQADRRPGAHGAQLRARQEGSREPASCSPARRIRRPSAWCCRSTSAKARPWPAAAPKATTTSAS